jgi:diguanylate cyclase (GGDEF)-like protein
MRGLANAAIEGLVVCDGEEIETVNESFATLVGIDPGHAHGGRLSAYFPDEAPRQSLLGQVDQAVELGLRHSNGSIIAVEAIRRSIDFDGKRCHAVAVRDLRRRKQAEEHIRFLAHHDPLTGIPNRSSFNAKLDEAITTLVARGEYLAVLCLDLDRFKEVNDLFGHPAGDALLRNVARRVTTLLEPAQCVARIGGDEFAIILPAISGPAAAGRMAEKILDGIRADAEGHSATVLASASIGIAMCPDDGTDRDTLLNHADTALYRAKSDGRATYRFFESNMGDAVRDRRLLEHDLRHAIGRGELRLVYQPQQNIGSGDIVGLEALLRWKHPARGDVSPAVFIPIAEESGSILQIGEWVLRAACAEAASWTNPLTVAVNVSTVQLHNGDFGRRVHEILLATGLPARRLELEITETALINDLNRTLATLRQLKALGIRIAMDDFGTGYSSLSNLRAFPFDKIKIDGSFIRSVDRNQQGAAIVRAVLGLGQGLGLPVLAEGVETASELEFLAKETAACQEAQGYLIGKPNDIAAFRELTHGLVRSAAPTKPARSAEIGEQRAAG